MIDCTIISYPGHNDLSLLSLTEARSRYMLPLGGRFRVIDFTLRNSIATGIQNTIIVSNIEDNLQSYIQAYTEHHGSDESYIDLFSQEDMDLEHIKEVIEDVDTKYYILYNGDNPSIIDFDSILKKYNSLKSPTLLFKLPVDGKATMAYTILVTNKKKLLGAIKKAKKEKMTAPNLFEMLINMMIHDGLKKVTASALYWPIRNIPQYDALNRDIIWNPEISDMLFKENIIKSNIISRGHAYIGRYAKVKDSFISDNCQINGKVENSIIFPGVEIGRNTVVKNSIILPFVKIGDNCKILNAIIDETTEMTEETIIPNIGDLSVVGSENEQMKNNDFPRSLFKSITLIGKNNHMPVKSRIGGACYVASDIGTGYFNEKRFLYDGLSVVS